MNKLIQTPWDELTYNLNGLAMQVQAELKAGHREGVYQRRLADLIRGQGLLVEVEKRVEVYVSDSLVGYMFLDLWVENQIVLECKAHSRPFASDEIGQVVTYLAATGAPLGLLYNFGQKRLIYKRILPPKDVQEWRQYLFRCVWTPPGQNSPTLTSLEATAPVRFSVVSQSSSPSSPVRSVSPDVSASIRLSATHPLETVITNTASSGLTPIASSSSSLSPSPSAIRSSASSSVYESSGVSIAAGNRAVALMKESVQATYGPEVLAGIGAFGGLFDASGLQQLRGPVLVASTDGVGTKVKLAAQAGRYESIGHDIVNHCINDILVQGARPLFFLDYVASAKLKPEMVAAVVSGIAAACRAAGCALLGGETAEMPGVYQSDEFDVAGTIVGVVERERILPRIAELQAGDVLLGLTSSGPHTNGFSLIRKIFDEIALDTVLADLGGSLADALLAPHRSYLNLLAPLLFQSSGLAQSPISNLASPKALAHLTGGGFLENIPRVLPPHLSAEVRLGSWPVLPIFNLIQAQGEVTTEEMHRVFNMGIGMVLFCAPDQVATVQAAIPEPTYIIGQLIPGPQKVVLV